MKGYRFYEELRNKNRKGELSKGTVLAMPLNQSGSPLYFCGQTGMHIEVFAAVFDEKNSPVCECSADDEYIREKTRKVSEKRAREIHPALFDYLDS